MIRFNDSDVEEARNLIEQSADNILNNHNKSENEKREYKRILDEAKDILEHAKSQGRGLNAEEQGKYNAKKSRLDELETNRKKTAALSLAAEMSNKEFKKHKNTFQFNKPLKTTEKLFNRMGFDNPEMGLGRFMRASVLGPRNDAERKILQFASDSTGGFEIPLDVAAQFIDSVRGESVYVKAGAMVVPMDRSIKASSVTDPTATFRAENASVAEAEPFASVALAPKSLSVIVKVSREQIDDSVNVDSVLEETLSRSMALALDKAIGFGGSDSPTGIFGTSGIEEVAATTNGDQLTNYAKLLDALYKVQLNNAQPTAVVLSPREAKAVNLFEDTTEQPLRRPEALNMPFYATASIPVNQTQGSANNASTILVADFSKLLIAVRVGLRLEVLKEKYAGNFQYGFQATLRIDSLVTRPKSFCKVTGLIP